MELISDPRDLKPDTPWRDTIWAWTGEESLVDHRTKARLCVATLLPFRDRRPDWDGFVRSIAWMRDAPRGRAWRSSSCSMPTPATFSTLDGANTARCCAGFARSFRTRVSSRASPGPDAGATAFKAERYRPMLDIVQQYGNCEAMLMTSRRLNALDPERRRDAYFEIAEHLTVPGIVHALEPAFVPWATPYEPWLLHELAQHPKFVGGKISTLDEPHFLCWAAMCRSLKLDFAPHSGDDYGIGTAIRLGLPLLIGAGVSACPLICAAKNMWLADGHGPLRHAGLQALRGLPVARGPCLPAR